MALHLHERHQFVALVQRLAVGVEVALKSVSKEQHKKKSDV
jgi:hypothetical protein